MKLKGFQSFKKNSLHKTIICLTPIQLMKEKKLATISLLISFPVSVPVPVSVQDPADILVPVDH